MVVAEPLLDCVVIGAGPAGLTAALYLARFRRQVAVLDGGRSRAALIPVSHNFPGYPDGIAGPALLRQLVAQAARYGGRVIPGRVRHLRRDAGGFRADSSAGTWRSRTVLLATGCVDLTPPWPTALDAVRGGFLRYCPVCDGYEVIDREVGVLGRGEHGAREALFLRHYTARLTLLAGGPPGLPPALAARLAAAGVAVDERPLRGGEVVAGRFRCRFADGDSASFDSVYLALGARMRSGLARRLGAAMAAQGELVVDRHQQTTVPGLYAAGDVVLALSQMAVAIGQAATAATAIHNRLRAEEVGGGGGVPAPEKKKA